MHLQCLQDCATLVGLIIARYTYTDDNGLEQSSCKSCHMKQERGAAAVEPCAADANTCPSEGHKAAFTGCKPSNLLKGDAMSTTVRINPGTNYKDTVVVILIGRVSDGAAISQNYFKNMIRFLKSLKLKVNLELFCYFCGHGPSSSYPNSMNSKHSGDKPQTDRTPLMPTSCLFYALLAGLICTET